MATASQTVDLRGFESGNFKWWLGRFQRSSEPGDWRFFPYVGKLSFYGATDTVFALAILNQLANFTQQEKATWADTINTFQNDSGLYIAPDGEFNGWQPWHATAQGASALNLLGHVPQKRIAFVDDLAGQTRSDWNASLFPLLHTPLGIHHAVHKLVGYPAIILDTHNATTYADFLDWWLDWLEAQVNADYGLWCFQERFYPPDTTCVGGSFAILSAFEAANRTVPYREIAVDTVLGLQQATGLWSNKSFPSWIDMDAFYVLTRSSRLSRYRWDDIQAAAARFVSNIGSVLMGDHARLALACPDTHLILPLLNAVAEVQRFFPELVATTHPWTQCLDHSAFI